jgi:hypothetical protein
MTATILNTEIKIYTGDKIPVIVSTVLYKEGFYQTYSFLDKGEDTVRTENSKTAYSLDAGLSNHFRLVKRITKANYNN